MTNGRVVAKSFAAKDFVKAVEFKENIGGIMIRIVMPTGVFYEIRFLPPPEPVKETFYDYIIKQHKFNMYSVLSKWPAFGNK